MPGFVPMIVLWVGHRLISAPRMPVNILLSKATCGKNLRQGCHDDGLLWTGIGRGAGQGVGGNMEQSGQNWQHLPVGQQKEGRVLCRIPRTSGSPNSNRLYCRRWFLWWGNQDHANGHLLALGGQSTCVNYTSVCYMHPTDRVKVY